MPLSEAEEGPLQSTMAVVDGPENNRKPVTRALGGFHLSGELCGGKDSTKAGVVLPSGVPGNLRFRHHPISGRDTSSASHPTVFWEVC